MLASGCGPAGDAPSASSYGVKPPVFAAGTATDSYHGVTVADPYRRLEDGSDPEVKGWSAGQNAAARAWLDALPDRAVLRARLNELLGAPSPSWSGLRLAGGRLFAVKKQPPRQQPFLVVMDASADPATERTVLDPNMADPSGATSIDFFEPSFDGAKVAVSMSKGGSEAGDARVYDVATGKDLGDVVPRVNGGTAGGSIAWNGAGTGFWYTRYPRAGERPAEDLDFYQQVWFHTMGTPTDKDRYEIGKEFPRIAEVQLESSPDGAVVLASVQKGDGGEFTHHLRRADGRWIDLTRYEDQCVLARLGGDGAVWFVSRKDAPLGKILRLPVDGPEPSSARATVVIPEGTDAMETDFMGSGGLWLTGERVYVHVQQGGPTVLKAFGRDGRPYGPLPAEPVSAITAAARAGGDDLFFRDESMTTPPAWYRWDARAGKVVATKLAEKSPADFSRFEVVRDQAVSKDGTKIPLTILRPKGAKFDGSNPTLVYGYGGYGLSQAPIFRARLLPWLEHGGVYVLAHIRGGGEFGERWHLEGNLTKKQNVFDDFAAAAQRVVELGYAKPEKLAAMGGSNGGLLMGAMIVQHPGMFRAVVSFVGLYDALRAETTPNGAFNVTEFGTVKDPEQFKALYAYSPYHNVKDGTAYPSVLMLTGENDPRVDPWHSRKMVARLQAATTSGRPILLRTSATSGHGVGTALNETIEEYTDAFGFLMKELGM